MREISSAAAGQMISMSTFAISETTLTLLLPASGGAGITTR